MEDKVLTGQESLELISRMINTTRNRFERHAGTPFVIWGYATLVTSLVVWFLLTRTLNGQWNYLWFSIIPLGVIGMCVAPRDKVKHVRTFIDNVVSYIWIVIGICAVTASVVAMFGPLNQILFIEALLINIGAALTGLTIRLRYVAVMGFIGIAISFLLLFFREGIDQILIFALLVTTTMIIPGHIMNAQGRRLNPEKE